MFPSALAACAALQAAGWMGPAAQTRAPGPRIEISFPAAAHDGPITGRVYFILSRTETPEPRLQVGRTGVPFFGRDVEALAPGATAVIDETDLGSPVESLKEIPPGDYFVQAFINVYSEFRRADGHVLWLHDDRWEGQQWRRSPGNLHSAVRRVRLDPAHGGTISLVADQVIPPIAVPPDTEWVRRFKFQSPMLTRFWGRPIYLGATVLLPHGYDRETESYPVNYLQGHFSLEAPLRFEPGSDLHREWIKDDFPQMLVVTFQDPTPYFDTSYGVNSVNVGPYGDAIMQELIPEVEKRFRVIREAYARILSGGSTGGWEALALQIFHPDFFGGTWAYCPDPVTFSDVEGINIYEDANAFYKQHEWRRVVTPNTRETDGRLRLTSRQRSWFELVSGTKGRSGEQFDIWSAAWGPIGRDGYPELLFDKRTGEMNPRTVQYWQQNFDLLYHLKRDMTLTHHAERGVVWEWLGPKLVDKLHIYTGNMDSYYLNNAVRELQQWLKTTRDPHYEGFFLYGDGKGHCWSGPMTPAERLKEMAQFVMRRMPEGATTPWWTY